MKQIVEKIHSLEVTLIFLTMVCLYATDHYIAGGVTMIVFIAAINSLGEKKENKDESTNNAA